MGRQPDKTRTNTQHKMECCPYCDIEMDDDVHIECVENDDGEEMTLCASCWAEGEVELREQGWRFNEFEEEERKAQFEEEQAEQAEREAEAERKAHVPVKRKLRLAKK